jgi:hypothetical protein
MPRYYMHLIDGADILLDPDGADLEIERVAASALAQARDCMAGDVKGGRLDLGYRIDVHDESGNVVHTQQFQDAVEIVRSA